jgi:hypothetical protein
MKRTIVATLSHFSDRTKPRPGRTDRLGPAATYRLSEPLRYEDYDRKLGDYRTHETRYIWVSTAEVMGRWETYIFPCYASGKVHSWGELPGSVRHDTWYLDDQTHESVLTEAGFTVAASVSRKVNGKRK